MNCSLPGSFVMGFSRQEYWSGLPLPSRGYLSNPGIEPRSSLQAGSLLSELQGSPNSAYCAVFNTCLSLFLDFYFISLFSFQHTTVTVLTISTILIFNSADIKYIIVSRLMFLAWLLQWDIVHNFKIISSDIAKNSLHSLCYIIYDTFGELWHLSSLDYLRTG